MTFRGIYSFCSLSFCFVIVAWAVLGAGCSVKEREMDHPLLGLSADRPKYQPEELDKDFNPTQLEIAFFETDKSVLTAEAKEALNKTALWMKKHPEANLQIEGYCDERGSQEHNMKLGARRAETTRRYLIQQGVASSRLTTVAVGKVPGGRWSENRRAGLIVMYR